MKLLEVFNQLTYGELSQISLGGAEAGEINSTNYDKVVAHINLGLTALYKRFPLKEGRLTVALQQGRMTYPLNIAYAVSNAASSEPIKYILDSTEEFIGDIHKVEGVFTAAGYELGLNDQANPYAVMTPSAQVLRIPATIVANSVDLPEELKTTELSVVYRANHPIIDVNSGAFDPETYEVELPYSHLEPLLLYVASRVNNPIGMTNEFHAGNSYAAKYEQACQQLEQFNLKVDQGSQYNRLESKGWV
jgi:hypothetical protein